MSSSYIGVVGPVRKLSFKGVRVSFPEATSTRAEPSACVLKEATEVDGEVTTRASWLRPLFLVAVASIRPSTNSPVKFRNLSNAMVQKLMD